MSKSSRSGSRVLVISLSLAFLILLVIGNYYLFAFFKMSYLKFWLEQGSLTVLALTFVSLVWNDLDQQHPNLISAHPTAYLSTCFMITSGIFYAIAYSVPSDLTQSLQNVQVPSVVRLIYDSIFGLILFLMIALIAFAWLLIVAPMMYFTSLITGAPARLAMLSGNPRKALVRSSVNIDKKLTGQSYTLAFSNKPVTVTAAITAAMFWLIKITKISEWLLSG